MDTGQAIGALSIFLTVMALLITEATHFTVAAFLGALILICVNILTLREAIDYIAQGHTTLGLFFGVMVMVRAFEPTKLFDWLAAQMVLFAQGKGKRLLYAIVAMTALPCTVLPSATTVMLLAPLIPPIAQDVGIDFVPLLILMVLTANSSGLLTIVGEPAKFIVGDAINISFMEYLWRLSLGGVIAIGVLIMMLPFLFPKIWHKELDNLNQLPHPTINHPRILALGIVIVLLVLIFFVVGDSLPVPVSPATVALLGGALCLFLAHHSEIDSAKHVLRDVDWSTLIFFMSIFVLIGGLEKTGLISAASRLMAAVLGTNIAFGTIVLVFLVGAVSSIIPNIPLVLAMVPLLKQYIVTTGFAEPDILASDYAGQFPMQVLPLFYAMMYGATLGGNGTLVGASSNIVAAGISEQHGKRIPFKTFLRYGVPVALAQLTATCVYLIVRFLVV